MKEINKPKLRFKEFENDWDYKALKDIANIVGGGTPKTDVEEYWGGSINWFSPNELNGNPYVYDSDKKITELGLKKSSAKLHPVNTILFTSRAGIGKMAILKKPATTNQGFQSLELKEGYDPYFIYSCNDVLKRKAIRLSSGSTFNEISKIGMESIKLSIPTFKEQNEIGDFFNKLDCLINLKEDKVSSLERLKRGYLQKTLADLNRNIPELRFKKFTDNWKLLKVKEIFQNVSNKNNINEKVLSVTQDNGLVYRDNLDKSITYDKDSLKNYKMVDPDDVVISLRSFQGGFEISNKSGIVSPAYTVMKFKNDNYNRTNINYWKTFLKSYYFIQLLKKVTYGVRDGRSISYKDFSSLYIRIPSIEEQREIGSYFDLIDKQINLQKNELEHLERLKKGYLQKMFV